MEICGKKYANWLSKLKEKPDNRDKRKYCHFHCDHDHNTEKYRTTKDEIEYLIRQGHLNRFKKKT